MQLAALHKSVDLFFSLPPANHTMYVINTDGHALKHLSQDCMIGCFYAVFYIRIFTEKKWQT